MLNLDEVILVRIAGVFTILGLIIIYFSSVLADSEAVDIQNIDDSYIGKVVRLEGTINSFELSKETLFVSLNGRSLTIVFFNYRGPSFFEGDFVGIDGRVERYKGELEIVASRIEWMENT